MSLSKSQYIRGLQCSKSLWLYKHRPELRRQPSDATEALFETGYEVGDLAKGLFPGGVEIAFDPEDFAGMIAKTLELIEAGQSVIYEATFREEGIFAMVDILVRNGSVWDLYEVKASTEVKGYHLDDAAIQYYALQKKLDLGRAYVVHINNRYVRKGALDLRELFAIEDVTEEVMERLPEIPERIGALERMLEGPEPEVAIGPQCFDPFECDFRDHCWQNVPSPSVFDLYRMRSERKFRLYHDGKIRYEDLPGEPLNETQRLQVESALEGRIHIQPQIIREFLAKIRYPVNFFDFETFQEAIPRFDGQRPYQQIPFQYSLHILHADGRLEHREFLGDEERDPRGELIERMLSDITPTGSIVAFNQAFEIGRIRELAEYAPDRAQELLALRERFVDLIEPFRRLGYYHPDFHGSFSIKSVLPAMFPNDPELDYTRLGSVQNGGDAMHLFANLHRISDPKVRESIRRDLLAYCRLDTLAMVRIFESLEKLV